MPSFAAVWTTKRFAGVLSAFALGLTGLWFVATFPEPAQAENMTLTETGSTLIYPLFQIWSADYAKNHPGVKVVPSATDSGAGVANAISGAVRIGASDAYMSDAEVQRNPGMFNIPMAISAQTVNYNLPDFNNQHLNLSGPALAGIYAGKIRMWDDPLLLKLNPGTPLPHHEIAAVRRKDESGDTFIFTQYLTFSTPWWESGIGYGRTIDWPSAPGALEASGNPDMVAKIAAVPYSIGYVGVSFEDAVAKAGLGTAAVQSYDGEFLLPTPESITAAAAALGPRTPLDERLTLVNAPGPNAYPLINYEYAIVSRKQPSPEIAAAIRKFLLWAIAPDEENEKRLAEARFVPLPAHIWVLSHDQIEMIR
jgi:phosphate transport system substrate-binding protein